jgi:hypothetical protein
VGDGDQEREALWHRYQQMHIGRKVLLRFGCRQQQNER